MATEYSMLCPILYGPGAINEVGVKAKELGCKKVLFVYGSSVKASGIGPRIEKLLTEAGVDFVAYNNVVPEPPSSVVNEAYDFAVSQGVDSVMCAGGGSAMDIAKAISVMLSYGPPLEQYLTPVPPVIIPKIPIILIPTTAGTGTESTRVCVIINSEVNLKRAVFIQATYGIIDPELTVTCPKKTTAQAGFDALAHCVESITAKNRNPFSETIALGAIKRIAKSLVRCYEHPDDVEARGDMCLASNWAGIAFSNTDIQVGHATCDSLSAAFGTPHGLECSWVTPEVIRFCAPAVPRETRLIAEALGAEITDDEPIESVADKCADILHGWMRKCEIKSLKEMGFEREKALEVAEILLYNQPHICKNCPIDMDIEKAQTLLANVYDNYQ